MPIYEYRCDKCGRDFEELTFSHDDAAAECPACGASARRLVSRSGFILKGSGWYVTDYKNSGSGTDTGKGHKSGSASKAA